MYRWYKNACVCYAYLSDQPNNACGFRLPSSTYFKQETSRWFTRGWTLQELLAPSVIEFYAADWTEIGTKATLSEEISRICGIRFEVLNGQQLTRCNVAERMSWAAHRKTSRAEDRAYSLMGLFNVNMPLLYGEGGVRAFLRLQEEILRTDEDYTIFVWADEGFEGSKNLLASSVTAFKKEIRMRAQTHPGEKHVVRPNRIEKMVKPDFLHQGPSRSKPTLEPPILTSRGLRLHAYVQQIPQESAYAARQLTVFLNCYAKVDHEEGGCVRYPLFLKLFQSGLRGVNVEEPIYERVSSRASALYLGSPFVEGVNSFKAEKVYARRSVSSDLTQSASTLAPVVVRLEMDFSLLVDSFPRQELPGWPPCHFTPLGGPVALLTLLNVSERNVVVVAGLAEDKPWCQLKFVEQNLQDDQWHHSTVLSDWHRWHAGNLSSLHSDRSVLRVSAKLNLYVSFKRRGGRCMASDRCKIYSLQIHVING
jgi:hypothetical protein